MANVLFTNVRILDGSGAQPFNGEVLVQGNRIARVGRGARAFPTAGVAVIDAAGADGWGDGVSTRRSVISSATSSSSVAAVTSGPAPGPVKHCTPWPGCCGTMTMPLVTPATCESGCMPDTNAGPTNALTADSFHDACAIGRMVPPDAAAAEIDRFFRRIGYR